MLLTKLKNRYLFVFILLLQYYLKIKLSETIRKIDYISKSLIIYLLCILLDYIIIIQSVIRIYSQCSRAPNRDLCLPVCASPRRYDVNSHPQISFGRISPFICDEYIGQIAFYAIVILVSSGKYMRCDDKGFY